MGDFLFAVDVFHIAPFLAAAVLQPKDCGCGVSGHLGAIWRINRLSGASGHEDLHFVLLVANSPLVQAALDALISGFLARL